MYMENQTITKEYAKTSPKDFFIYLGSIASLYIIIGSLLRIFFVVIDNYFKDNLADSYYYGYYATSISWPAAALIIIFPLYLGLMYISKKDIQQDPSKKELRIRKWLVYLTLFIAGIVIVGALVTLLYNFLNGEIITANFISKVLVVLITSALVFLYYMHDLKDRITREKDRVYAIIAGLVILISLILGFAVLGTPAEQRRMRFDADRVEDLSSIQSQIVEYWRNKGSLPENLASLNNDLPGYSVPVDPRTSENYTYRKTTDLEFELCAHFETESMDDKNTRHLSYGYGMDETWKHEKGEVCFKRSIDTDIIKRNPPTKSI